MTTPKRFYFDVDDLAYGDIDVVIFPPGGEEVIARRTRVVRRGRTAATWQVRVSKREPGRPTRHRYVDLPGHLVVTRWRPLSMAAFPGPLLAKPANMIWQSKPEPTVPPESEDDLEWPGEYGAAPNISVREL